MGYRADKTTLCHASFVVPVGCQVLQGGETCSHLRDAGQLPATTQCCCGNPAASGEYSTSGPKSQSGQL